MAIGLADLIDQISDSFTKMVKPLDSFTNSLDKLNKNIESMAKPITKPFETTSPTPLVDKALAQPKAVEKATKPFVLEEKITEKTMKSVSKASKSKEVDVDVTEKTTKKAKKGFKGMAKSIKGMMKGIAKSLGIIYILGELFQSLGVIEPIMDMISAFVSILGIAFLPVVIQLTDAFLPLIPIVMDFSMALQPIVGILSTGIGNALQFDNAMNGLTNGLQKSTQWLIQNQEAIANWSESVSNSIREGLTNFGKAIKDGITWIFNDMGNWIKNLARDFIDGIADELTVGGTTPLFTF